MVEYGLYSRDQSLHYCSIYETMGRIFDMRYQQDSLENEQGINLENLTKNVFSILIFGSILSIFILILETIKKHLGFSNQ